MSKLNSKWLAGVSKEDAKEVEESIRHSTVVITQLRALLTKEIEALQNTTESDYDTNNWAYLQAHRNGKVEALKQLRRLTDHIESK